MAVTPGTTLQEHPEMTTCQVRSGQVRPEGSPAWHDAPKTPRNDGLSGQVRSGQRVARSGTTLPEHPEMTTCQARLGQRVARPGTPLPEHPEMTACRVRSNYAGEGAPHNFYS